MFFHVLEFYNLDIWNKDYLPFSSFKRIVYFCFYHISFFLLVSNIKLFLPLHQYCNILLFKSLSPSRLD
uniref:Uncharacterized protein n=1 Tax=Octopus bimaculoides TaxID=37653 RepID=A0A0L8HDG4_OCTBM